MTIKDLAIQAKQPKTLIRFLLNSLFQAVFGFGLILQWALAISANTAAAESIGPSSRRSALSISEILYHPTNRADGLEAEFVELYNSQLWPEDISGFSLAGGINYVFPEGAIIPPQDFVVVAKSPSDVETIYGLQSPLGPFEGKLDNQGDQLQLLNRQGAVLLDISYKNELPWPLAAAGAGPSLILNRPSFGETSPKAWSGSHLIGGSPGHEEPPSPISPTSVHINEVWRHPSKPNEAFIELSNWGNTSIELSNMKLLLEPGGIEYLLPNELTLSSGKFHAIQFSISEFDLSHPTGRLFLIDPTNQVVIDSFPLSPHDSTMSLSQSQHEGKGPDIVSPPTPGARNAPQVESDVVINEIMFNPIAGRDDAEYIELFNRSNHSIDLSHWEISDDIQFTFPDKTVIASQGYLVVAKNLGLLREDHPQLTPSNSLGNFRGQLSNSGGTLTLARPTDWHSQSTEATNTSPETKQEVDRVSFHDRSRWSRWADGGGSSLELQNPDSDNGWAGNWADSDESSKADWSSVQFTGTLDRVAGTRPRSFQILLLEAGECLVDNVTIAQEGSENQIKVPDFEVSSNTWVFQGNHVRSTIVDGLGIESSKALRVTATQRGDPHSNRIRTTLNRGDLIAPNKATIAARVKWQRGFPEILFRLQNNFIEAFHRMEIPKNLGTPGLKNSQWEENPAPVIQDVAHSPVLPMENQPIIVSALVQDDQQLASVHLNYRVDLASAEWQSTPMRDDGIESDLKASDGIYTGIIPPQSARTTLLFSVDASDNASPSQHSTFPLDTEKHHCLVRIGVAVPENGLGVYRLWVSRETLSEWSSPDRPNTSNEPLDATFIYNDERIIYNVGAAYSGSFFNSPRYSSPTGTPCDYSVRFRNDEPFLGASKAIISWPGLTGSPDSTLQREQFSYWLADQIGLPSNYRRYVTVYVNGTQRNTVMEDTQRPNQDMVKQWFPEDDNGHLHKIQLRYESNDSATTTTAGLNSASLERSSNPDGSIRTSAYRWNWAPRSDAITANNFEPLFNLVDAVNTDDSDHYKERVNSVIDIDQWMRTFAVEHIVGNWDSYGYGNGQNMYAYKPNNGKWQLMIWDLDIGNGTGESARTSLFKLSNPFFPNVNGDTEIIHRMFQTPEFERAYWRALLKAATGPMEEIRVDQFLTSRFEALRTAIGRNRPASPTSISRYTAQRREYILGQLDRIKTDFAITEPQSTPILSEHTPVLVRGTAPISVEAIRINGIEHQPNWIDTSEWELSLPLTRTNNEFVFEAITWSKTMMVYPPVSITIDFSGKPGDLPPEILITEWMAINESTIADPVDGDFDDWIELHNREDKPIDLGGYTLTDDRLVPSKWTFPNGTTIPAKSYLLLWADGEPDQNEENDSLHLNFRLNRNGEHLALYTPNGALVDTVQFAQQDADQSEGRTGSSQLPIRQRHPSPGRANEAQAQPGNQLRISHIEYLDSDTIRLKWDVQAGSSVQLQTKTSINPNDSWLNLGAPIQGTEIEFPIESSQSFYRIIQASKPFEQ